MNAVELRRVRNGERVTQAHRSHLYQRLANGGWGHRRTTLVYVVAAAAGVLVAQLPEGRAWPLAVALYIAAVLITAAGLDRTRPFPWAAKQVNA